MPATLAELKAACPGATGDFLVKQLEERAEVTTAVQAYNADLRAQLDAKKTAPVSFGKPQGVTPPRQSFGPNDGGDEGGDTMEFSQLVDDFIVKHPDCTRHDAVQRVARAHPEAHQAFVVGSQTNKRARALAAQKYALEG